VPADGAPRGARLLERERPLDVHDDRACRAVAGLGRWCSSPGRWARPSCCGSWSSRASARTLPLWGDVRLAELAPPVGGRYGMSRASWARRWPTCCVARRPGGDVGGPVLEATSWLGWGASVARDGRSSPPACRRRRRP